MLFLVHRPACVAVEPGFIERIVVRWARDTMFMMVLVNRTSSLRGYPSPGGQSLA